MNILIVEDEDLAVKKIQKTLSSVDSEAVITGITDSIKSTVEWLQQHPQPDLILMDIELADGQSFEIFEKVQVICPVIFTTAYDEFALKAFKVNSIDYLLKPVKEEDLRRALDKLKNLRRTNEQESIQNLVEEMRRMSATTYRERILVRKGQKMIPITIDEAGIFFTHNSLNYLLTKSEQKYMIDYTLDQIEQSLHPQKFFRVNRQYILANDVVTAVHPWFNGKLKIEINLPVDEAIVVSRDKATLFKEWLGQ